MMNTESIHRWLKSRYWSLSARLTLVMILLVTITLAGATLVTIQTVRMSLNQQIGENFRTHAISQSDLIGLFLLEKTSQLQVLALANSISNKLVEHNATYTGSPADILAEMRALDAAWVAAEDDDPLITNTITGDPAINPVAHQLADFLESFPDHTEVFVTGRHGETVAATGRLSDYYQADEAWWQAAWNDGQGAIYISEPEFDKSAGVTALLIAVPIFNDESNEVVGVLRSTLAVDELFALFEKITFGQTGQALLLDGTGQVIFNPRAGEEGAAEFTDHLRRHFITQGPHSMVALHQQGQQSVFGHATFRAEGFQSEIPAPKKQIIDTLTNLGWVAVIQQETDEAFASVDWVVKNILLIELITAGLATLAALFVARTIIRPLVKLSAVAEEMATGNLDVPLPPAGNDEIGRLITSFGNMTARLKDLVGSLEVRTAELSKVNQELKQRAAQLALINDIGGKIAALLELDEVLEGVARLVHETFDYHHVALFLVDGPVIRLKAVAGSYETYFPTGHTQRLSQGINGWVATYGEKVIANDVSTEPRYISLIARYTVTQAELCLPIKVADQTVGILDIQSPRRNAFSENDVIAMQTLTDQIAVVIENARLYETLQQELAERRRAEQMLKAYAARLEQSNRELEDFAHVASHDLQEPLRKVQAFGDRLQTNYGEVLDNQGRDYLARMQNAAERMQNLIKELLAYSRVTTQAKPFGSVDLARVAHEVLDDLEVRIEQIGGQVDVGELPTIEADPVQMRQLFQNLFSNALKFRRPGDVPRVKVQATSLNRPGQCPLQPAPDLELCQVTVTDNGIGFDEKYGDRIFQVFQRLHGRSEYEGTGIGLATCRKIVERHGGCITAKSTPGQGATFIVTLPFKQPKKEDQVQ